MTDLDAMVDSLVRSYAAFLTASWPVVQERLRLHPLFDLDHDWKQGNWELLVESQLWSQDIYLTLIDEGAELYPTSTRVYLPDARATHKVVYRPVGAAPILELLSGDLMSAPEVPWALTDFVAWRDGWYHDESPFTHVCTQAATHDIKIFAIEDVRFFLAVATDEDQ